MECTSIQTVAPADVEGKNLILIENASQWFLAPRLDPCLEPGSMFLYNERLWMVTWSSEEGFGESVAH